MDTIVDTADFYDGLEGLDSFAALTDRAVYVPLPDDWVVGTADIVGSTLAIAEGRYKTVNTVGAAVISAQINITDRAFPFVFGGDGAAFACPPAQAEAAGRALGAVRRWAEEEFGLTLRAAQVPVATIRAAGREVAVARYRASPDVEYAMFAGGGITWAEAQMKAGHNAVPEVAERPDLSGLSCRWSPIRARNGTILSVVIQPAEGAPPGAFSALADRVIAIAHRLERDGHPVPPEGMGIGWPPAGLELEAHASRGDMPLRKRRRELLWETFLAWGFFRTGLKAAGFDPGRYRATVGRNADFRKFDDGLKMTLDCDPVTLDELRRVLEAARGEGVIDYGLYGQEEAMMTCIVPSIRRDDHVHFIDGAAGGYTQAAARMRAAPPRDTVGGPGQATGGDPEDAAARASERDPVTGSGAIG